MIELFFFLTARNDERNLNTNTSQETVTLFDNVFNTCTFIIFTRIRLSIDDLTIVLMHAS